MFRNAFKSKRCLIPASGYYEWHDAPGGKQPYYFTRRDGQPTTFAGLWSSRKDDEAGTNLLSCAMVITEPNKFAAEVHDRMPVIPEAKDFEQWEQRRREGCRGADEARCRGRAAEVAGVETCEQFACAGR
jgi:putative SOS response-associated peptidase YedK